MAEPRNVPAVSVVDAEDSHGTLADTAENPKDLDMRTTADWLCCSPVDVPGVGLTHAHDCAHSGRRYTLPAREGEPGEMPSSLRALLDQEERDGLLSQLIFAARDLAEANLRKSHLIGVVAGIEIRTVGCAECLRPALADHQPHNATCRTGRVLSLIGALMALPVTTELDSTLNRKEAAPAEETGRAGDGTRPRGLSECVCLRCGKRGGNWDRKLVPESEFRVNVLALNECAAPCPTPSAMRVVFVHHCESKLRGVDVLFADGGAKASEQADWIIRRCTQRWVGTELQYEDFPTPEGLMTRARMVEVLERVQREHPNDEFCGHKTRNQSGGVQ